MSSVVVTLQARAHVYVCHTLQYLTEAMDKLEVSQKKLGKVTEERDKALLNLAQLRQYVEELQKVCLRENAP